MELCGYAEETTQHDRPNENLVVSALRKFNDHVVDTHLSHKTKPPDRHFREEQTIRSTKDIITHCCAQMRGK